MLFKMGATEQVRTQSTVVQGTSHFLVRLWSRQISLPANVDGGQDAGAEPQRLVVDLSTLDGFRATAFPSFLLIACFRPATTLF